MTWQPRDDNEAGWVSSHPCPVWILNSHSCRILIKWRQGWGAWIPHFIFNEVRENFIFNSQEATRNHDCSRPNTINYEILMRLGHRNRICTMLVYVIYMSINSFKLFWGILSYTQNLSYTNAVWSRFIHVLSWTWSVTGILNDFIFLKRTQSRYQ